MFLEFLLKLKQKKPYRDKIVTQVLDELGIELTGALAGNYLEKKQFKNIIVSFKNAL